MARDRHDGDDLIESHGELSGKTRGFNGIFLWEMIKLSQTEWYMQQSNMIVKNMVKMVYMFNNP